MNWTKEQKKAIEKKDSNILVAAAAGSGKTAVLVERIINKITWMMLITNGLAIDVLTISATPTEIFVCSFKPFSSSFEISIPQSVYSPLLRIAEV